MTAPQKLTGLRPWTVGAPGSDETIRPFTREDWLLPGIRLRCACHGRLHTIVDAAGPFLGRDPSEGNREDCYWILILSDGGDVRMWEDRKGVITKREPEPA